MRADRLVSILLLLQTHGRMSAPQLARRLEVSERTILRDMEALGAAGVPVVAERGTHGGWSLMPGYRADVSGLNDAEAQALFVGNPPRLLADLRLDKASDRAMVKLSSGLPEVTRRAAELARQRIHIDVSGWHDARDAVPHLPLLQEAVWTGRRVAIRYEHRDDERMLDPLGLVAKGSVWYLVAAIDGDVRSYRVSRVREATLLDEPATRPPGFDLAVFWEQSTRTFRARLPRFEVVARVEASAVDWLRTMIRYGGIDSITDDERPGWRRVAMHFDAVEVARFTMRGMGGTAEVIEPEGLLSGGERP
jgi:predicted DNA-binding transcriptional regulator YafY